MQVVFEVRCVERVYAYCDARRREFCAVALQAAVGGRQDRQARLRTERKAERAVRASAFCASATESSRSKMNVSAGVTSDFASMRGSDAGTEVRIVSGTFWLNLISYVP